ncbi:MAG: flagellar FlbD family protein [Synergistaceae bacterium]|jgi:flagellar protein FlbD|nr:flagellar FlbD family protein [Synergistaceae bacterium]
MIELHRLNGELFLLNSDMIETVEVTPDTIVRLINGHRYVVRESFEDIRNDIVDFRKKVGYTCIPCGVPLSPEDSQ